VVPQVHWKNSIGYASPGPTIIGGFDDLPGRIIGFYWIIKLAVLQHLGPDSTINTPSQMLNKMAVNVAMNLANSPFCIYLNLIVHRNYLLYNFASKMDFDYVY